MKATTGEAMELFIVARFRAYDGSEQALANAMSAMLGPVRAEPGCLHIEAFRSIRDARLFFVHSRWGDEAAFDPHVSRPHTLQFVRQVQPMIEHALDVARVRPLSAFDDRLGLGRGSG